MSYVISIPSYETKDGYTLYKVQVKKGTGEVWSFQERYSVLREGHEQVRRTVRTQLPPFPPKKLWGNTKDAFVRVRRAALEEYFHLISSLPEIRNNEVFQSLIRPKTALVEAAPEPIVANLEKTNTKPAVQLTREIESRMTAVSTETASQFINLSDLPAPLDAEDLRRKQRDYGKAAAGVRLEWRVAGVRSEGEGRQGGLSRPARRWMEEKTRELESACGALPGAVVVAD